MHFCFQKCIYCKNFVSVTIKFSYTQIFLYFALKKPVYEPAFLVQNILFDYSKFSSLITFPNALTFASVHRTSWL